MMVQIIPNIALISAVVESIEPYDMQEGYSILSLNVQKASPRGREKFLYNKNEDQQMKAIVSDTVCSDAALKAGKKINAEVKKVSPLLWRILDFS
ncbi:MAG: hypothetical protein J0H29_03120 [Sphingobacteriales bacterium]|nr:hypothetical protein [Sphingobacteriales bacterium]OJY87309.1 MAG: hypothetical protein BGP14_09395 [Sphingobacteriales bacterium 44-15]